MSTGVATVLFYVEPIINVSNFDTTTIECMLFHLFVITYPIVHIHQLILMLDYRIIIFVKILSIPAIIYDGKWFIIATICISYANCKPSAELSHDMICDEPSSFNSFSGPICQL